MPSIYELLIKIHLKDRAPLTEDIRKKLEEVIPIAKYLLMLNNK